MENAITASQVIRLTIKGQSFELTSEEALALRNSLDKIFPRPPLPIQRQSEPYIRSPFDRLKYERDLVQQTQGYTYLAPVEPKGIICELANL